MDTQTQAAYDRGAADFAREWHAQPPPSDMHAILLRFFRPGPTADIGCGSGRDTAWLDRNGFPAIGYDASAGLLAEARLRYPDIRFEPASLPALKGIADASFANILCETVIMHLPPEEIAPSVRRMVALLRPGGTLYLSWRVTPDADRRDDLGRFYAAFDPVLATRALAGTAILFDEQVDSASSGKLIRRLVAQKDT